MDSSSDLSTRKVVLLTGASRGLGLSILRALIEDGTFHIIATARSQSLDRFKDLDIFESDNLWLRPLDVLIKKDRDAVIKEANEKFGGVDILINNAGYLLRAVVEHVGEMERYKQIDTNFRAPIALIRAVLPGMRKKRDGKIINISSVGGMMAMPTMAIYSASKFALEGASESLWYEVRPWNIKVSLIQPGFINSDSYENVKYTRESEKSIHNKNEAYYYHYKSMLPFIERVMKLTPSTPEKVAKVVLKTMKAKNPPLRVSATIDAVFFNILRRILPRSLYHYILYYSLPKVLRWGEDN